MGWYYKIKDILLIIFELELCGYGGMKSCINIHWHFVFIYYYIFNNGTRLISPCSRCENSLTCCFLSFRASDFRVNEIDVDGKVVELTDLTVPKFPDFSKEGRLLPFKSNSFAISTVLPR